MSQVNWSQFDGDGDRFENLVATLLLKKHGEGFQPKPSQGDSGRDFVMSDGLGRRVFQMKSFSTHQLNSSRWRQIIDSLKKCVATTPDLTDWVLVTPSLATEPQRDALQAEIHDLKPGLSWRWLGERELDLLCAEEPMVAAFLTGSLSEEFIAHMTREIKAIAGLDSDDPAAFERKLLEVGQAMSDKNPLYNIVVISDVDGQLDPEAVERSMSGLVYSTRLFDPSTGGGVIMAFCEKVPGLSKLHPVKGTLKGLSSIGGTTTIEGIEIRIPGMLAPIVVDQPGEIQLTPHPADLGQLSLLSLIHI